MYEYIARVDVRGKRASDDGGNLHVCMLRTLGNSPNVLRTQ